MRFVPTILLLIIAIASGAWAWERSEFAAPGPAAPNGAPATIVDIAPHQGLMAIAKRLERAGAVRNAWLFAAGVRLDGEGGRLKAGEYKIGAHLSMKAIAELLISGRVIEHKLTAAEGLTSQMVAGIVNADPALSGPPQTAPAEGSLLPETYLFTRGTERGAILARMHAAQLRFLDRAWASRTPGLPLRSPADAVTLASIVEKETAIAEERRHIASVFVNRLRLGMKLESDPTVIYGLSKGYPLGHDLRASELASVTPYNTYQIAGLPPTPICNPGKDSILAVLNPETSNDLYFVANGTGGHAFAATKDEQDRNVAHWRRIQNTPPQPQR